MDPSGRSAGSGATERHGITFSGIRRPAWVCSNSKQPVVIVGDVSPSMQGEKVAAASRGRCELLEEIVKPSNKDGFYVGFVEFHGTARTVQPLVKATALAGRVPPLHIPPESSSTDITAALDEASCLLEQTASLQEGLLQPVVLLFTDGQHNGHGSPEDSARRLKEKATLVTVAYGSDADEGLLRRLATSEQHFYRCSNGAQLRQFLAAVGATLVQTQAQQTKASIALGQLGR